jgi:hypothetical protein
MGGGKKHAQTLKNTSNANASLYQNVAHSTLEEPRKTVNKIHGHCISDTRDPKVFPKLRIVSAHVWSRGGIGRR